MTGAEYGDTQLRRSELTAAWVDWLAEHRIDAVIEPTVPIVAPLRGARLRRVLHRRGGRLHPLHALLELDRLPGRRAALGRRLSAAGCRSGVSLIGAPGAEWLLLGLGIELQEELGVPRP